MRRIAIALAFLLIPCAPVFLMAQTVAPVAPEGEGSYPVSAHDILWKQEEEINRYVLAHPEVLAGAQLQKTTWSFVVGSTYSWYADDLTATNSRYAVSSTCRAVGTHCYVFVEDASWGSRVTQAAVDSVVHAFDSATPADPGRGIYQTDVDTFGNPPDVDGDPKIIILILDIKDGFTGSGGYVVGYFYSFNEMPKVTPYETSNYAEIYFLDCNPLNLTTVPGIQKGMSTTAHEFQHMIHWNYNKLGDTFTNEGCSLMAEVVCGYPLYDQSGFGGEPNHYLFDWRRTDNTLVLRDYSRAARFFLYVKEQFGLGLFKTIVQTNLAGIGRLDAALAAATPATSRRFADIFQDWLVANYLNDRSVDSKWGYLYPSIVPVTSTVILSPNVGATGATIANLGALYLSFRSGSSLSTTITSAAPASNFWIMALESGTAGKRVLPVTLGVPFSEPAFGTGYSEVTYLIGGIDASAPHDVTYSSTGVGGGYTELKWDVSEPTGYIGNAAGDTVCVQFDGYPGARLDSVRVALRRTGSMTGGIWRYTGASRPTPLGAPLAVPIAVTGMSTPPFPYPVPWPNWGSADVHAQNIDASQPFAVALVCTGAYSTDNRVMTTQYPGTNPYHSFTYVSAQSNWFYYTNSTNDSVSIYIMRAYVSIPTAIGRETIELVPSSTQLLQNYPNPFNPSTTIGYSLSSRSEVLLRIFDIMGREVTTLVRGELPAGRYQVVWKGEAEGGMPVASGVYLCRLEAGSYLKTERILLVR